MRLVEAAIEHAGDGDDVGGHQGRNVERYYGVEGRESEKLAKRRWLGAGIQSTVLRELVLKSFEQGPEFAPLGTYIPT
ncbi:hypothetical protein VTO42DRAFT_1617 [Malbranchea cinnamomea]